MCGVHPEWRVRLVGQAYEDSKALADEIPGSSFTMMEGLGHFPMCEDYEGFSGFLLPILEEIRQNSAQLVS